MPDADDSGMAPPLPPDELPDVHRDPEGSRAARLEHGGAGRYTASLLRTVLRFFDVGDTRQLVGAAGLGPSAPDDDGERLKADAELRDRLAACGFAGPDYLEFTERLAAYGIAVCTSWLASGLMFHYCALRGRSCGPPPTDWSRQDRTELALETVAVALQMFHDDALVGGRWVAGGGASLKTYFIGTCVLAFPNVYRGWHAERHRWDRSAATARTLARVSPPQPQDPEDKAIMEDLVSQGLAGLSPTTRTAILMTGAGYSHEEIAEVLGTTTRSVEAILYRHRRRISRPGRNGVSSGD